MKDQIEGNVNEQVGAVKSAAGKSLGDEKLQADGDVQQTQGAVQKAAGDIKDRANDAVDAVKNAIHDRNK